MERTLALRIVVLDPPAGVVFCLQRGRVGVGDGPTYVPATHEGPGELMFDLAVRVAPELQSNGAPLFLGGFAHGTPRDRFVYVASGRPAAAASFGWQWDRRAKVPLGGITPELIEEALALPGGVLLARIAGKARDGRAAAATVPLLGDGWQVVGADLR